MPLQATSGAASYDAFGGGVPVTINYIEDVFSTYLYTGTGAAQTITNNIDLSGKGGLVWIKNRTMAAQAHALYDTARGVENCLKSNTTAATDVRPSGLTTFSSSGFSVGTYDMENNNGSGIASWTFRKQPKFFDIVTYTGDSVFDRVISHNLGAVPAVIIIKCTNTVEDWIVRTTAIDGSQDFLYLNKTDAKTDSGISNTWSTTTFTVGGSAVDNGSGNTYVAYLFASNAGGFGLTGTDNVISCGSYTGNGASTGPTVTLGYEPQWLMVKASSSDPGYPSNRWTIIDNMRGWPSGPNANSQWLMANTSDSEQSGGGQVANMTSTGFTVGAERNDSGVTFIYIAIRRGPMKVPTSGTSVYNGITRTGTGANATVTGVGFAPDLAWIKDRGGNFSTSWDRLRGATKLLRQTGTSAEETFTDALTGFDVMDGVRLGTDNTAQYINLNAATYINWNFRRAPSFFDEVCYTGTGTAGQTFSHNLGVAPELIIIKRRDAGASWVVGQSKVSAWLTYLYLNATNSIATASTVWNDTAPTSSVFTVGDATLVNDIAATYVAYLFATCAGVSKVGSYTGTGTTKQIECGFTAGARFVLIKRTDSTGAWYVWDSARGIVSGNDPYLLLNSTAAEDTSTDYIDTYSAGFEISSTAPAAINASAGTFVFLAIA